MNLWRLGRFRVTIEYDIPMTILRDLEEENDTHCDAITIPRYNGY